jgi:hypothetical protein
MMKITFALVAGLLLASTSAMSEMGYQLRETTIDSNRARHPENVWRRWRFCRFLRPGSIFHF